MQENLNSWMLDKLGRDQFVLRSGDMTEVFWNDGKRGRSDLVSCGGAWQRGERGKGDARRGRWARWGWGRICSEGWAQLGRGSAASGESGGGEVAQQGVATAGKSVRHGAEQWGGGRGRGGEGAGHRISGVLKAKQVDHITYHRPVHLHSR